MKKLNLLIWPILALGTFLRFWNLGARPFDGDEGVVLKIASGDTLKEVFQGAASDVHPPLLHFLTYISHHTFGISEFSARFFPALAGIGAVYLAYLILRRLFDEKVAILGGFFTAISSALIYSSQEVRFYSLLTFFFFGAFYFALKISEKNSFLNWLWLTIFAIGLVYTQHLGWFLLFGLAAFLLWRKFRPNIGKLLVMAAAILLLYLPQLPITIAQIQGRISEQPLLASFKSNLVGILNAFYRFGAGRIFLDLGPSISANINWAKTSPLEFILFLATLIIPAAFFIVGLVHGLRKYKKASVAFGLIIFGIVIALFVSEIGAKASRYLIFLAPFYYGFVALGIISLSKTYWGKILIALSITIFMWALVNYYSFTIRAAGENKVADYLEENVKSGEAILVKGAYGGGETFVLNYYWPKEALQPQIFDFYGDYKTGNLAALKAIDLEEKIAEILVKYPVCWYYDFTYAKDSEDLATKKQIQPINLGLDKEKKPIKIWRY